MSKLSMLEEKINASDYESELINKCSGDNKINTEYTQYGYKNTYDLGLTKVVLEFMQYANGEDDYDDELVSVKSYA